MPEEKEVKKKKSTKRKKSSSTKEPAKKVATKKVSKKRKTTKEIDTDEREIVVGALEDIAHKPTEEDAPEHKAPVIQGGPIIITEETVDAERVALAEITTLPGALLQEDTGYEPLVDDDTDGGAIVDNSIVEDSFPDTEDDVTDQPLPVVEEKLPDIAPAHDDYIVTPSQKNSLLRKVFYIILIIDIFFGVYIAISYGFVRQTISYEYQGDFLGTQIIQEEAEATELQYVEVLGTPTGFLRVRQMPSTSSTELIKVFPGDTAVLIGEDGEWYEIRLENEVTGWVFATYLKLLSN